MKKNLFYLFLFISTFFSIFPTTTFADEWFIAGNSCRPTIYKPDDANYPPTYGGITIENNHPGRLIYVICSSPVLNDSDASVYVDWVADGDVNCNRYVTNYAASEQGRRPTASEYNYANASTVAVICRLGPKDILWTIRFH